MGGYSKNIAVIRGLKDGFSADGGALSGLIKAEKYGRSLIVEASLINFAPLTEGRYVVAVSDGNNTQILDGTYFNGVSEVDTSQGFAALVCYVNAGVFPVASAVNGRFSSAALGIRAEIEKSENIKKEEKDDKICEKAYEDEALAEDNYYEYGQTDENGGAVLENQEEKETESILSENEASACPVESEGLARGMCFYERMKGEIETLLEKYPVEENLEKLIENSRWIRITYGEGKFYVFGVIYCDGLAQYICYGVPSLNAKRPPASMEGMASFIPAGDEGGYWVMYQDAFTGASVKIENA